MAFGAIKMCASDSYEETGIQKDSWGLMRFWVNGKNIFRYKNNVPAESYHWNLSHIASWFSERIGIIMAAEPFPLLVKGKNSIELMEQCEKFDSEDSDEYDRWHEIRFEWNEKHGFIAERDGSLLPMTYFRKVKDQIEIAWDNRDLYDNQNVEFFYLVGVELIDAEVFYKVILDFLNSFFKTFEHAYPKEIAKYKSMLQGLHN